MNVFISIIMVTYGHEQYIREAIEGVLMQEGDFDFELIIANDCSFDNTDVIISELLKSHPKADKIRYIKHDKNIGMMPNFIFALQQAQGNYIALCDGDDYWTDPYKLQKQVDFLETNPDYVLSFHKIKILKPNGELVEDFITKVPENYETQETLARLGNYIHTPSVVFRNVIKEFPPEIALTPIGDYFLYMLLAEQGKLKYIDEEMAVYRYGVGVISKMNNFKIAYNNIKMYSCMIGAVKEVKIKIIFMKRQEEALSLYKSTFDIKDSFIIKIPFFLIYLKDRSKEFIFNPRKSLRRIKNKIKQVFSK